MVRHYQDNETRRRQVAEATLQTLVDEGVAGFTARSVAEKVGISDGTLFRHFGNKADIVLEAMRVLEAEIDAGLAETGSPLQDLEAFFRHRAAFVGAENAVGRLIFSETLFHLAGDAGREQLDSWRQKSVGYLLGKLGALRMNGQLTDDLDVPAISMFFQGALLTFAMQASLGHSGTSEELNARIDHSWNSLQTVLFTK